MNNNWPPPGIQIPPLPQQPADPQGSFWQLFHERLPLPTNYTSIDCETSGFSHSEDVLIDIGFSEVRDGKLAKSDNILLNWGTVPGFDLLELDRRLRKTADHFAAKGRLYPYTVEYLRVAGVPAQEGIQRIGERLQKLGQDREAIAGHNFIQFDTGWISRTLSWVPGCYVQWVEDDIVDTAMIEKGSQLWQYPWPGDTWATWYQRVRSRGSKGLKWNLDTHCQGRYKLATAREMQGQHTAVFDTVLVYRLIEAFRNLR